MWSCSQVNNYFCLFAAVDGSNSENNKKLRQKESSQGVVIQKKQTPAQELQDDDDEFSGDDILGLIDTPQKPTAGKKTSRFDELLGRKQPQEDKQPKKEEHSTVNTDHDNLTSSTENLVGTIATAKDDGSSKKSNNDLQFGGYLPSSMSSNISNRKSRTLPQGRRKGLSDSAITERPSTAPGKKSVRFSDTVDSDIDTLRPSSTPAVKEHMKQEKITQRHPSSKDPTVNLKDIQTEPTRSTTSITTTNTVIDAVKEKSTTNEPSTRTNRFLSNINVTKYVYLLCFSVFGMNNDDMLVERPPTGSRRRRVTLPIDQQSLNMFESSESATLLPSQERYIPSKPHPSATPTMHQDAVKNNEMLSTVNASVMSTSTEIHSTIPPADTALQQQLTQQQLLMQQQSLQLQQLNSELATTKMQLEQARSEGEKNATKLKEKLLQELDPMKSQLKELLEELQEEKTMSSKLKACPFLYGYLIQ